MAGFSLPSKNVKLIIVGLLVLMAGFILLMGGGSSDPDVFNPAMFNARRMIVAPVVMVAGIITIIVAIMRTPKSPEDGE